MSSRTRALLLAAGLLLVLWLGLSLVPAPYVVMSPGPTVNLLAQSKGKELVEVSGAQAYHDGGALRMLTVVSTGPGDHVSLVQALVAWLTPGNSVYRYDDIYRPVDTSKTLREDAAVDMVSSQDTAVAVAMKKLGVAYKTRVQVLGVVGGGPSDGKLEVHDQILKVDGVRTKTTTDVVDNVKSHAPGAKIAILVRRAGQLKTVTVTSTKSAQDPTKAAVQVTVGLGYDFPFKVAVDIDPSIGGPSAGMMFTTAIYDTLTPGALTGGKSIAGTGTIDVDGKVGPIGGIQQKLAAAEAAGAKLFLAPAGNCAEVVDSGWADHEMRVVRVDTFDQAITDIEAWRDDPQATLAACTS